jgi:hypothetical protein
MIISYNFKYKMSNFFQTSIKKEKLNRSKNNDNKTIFQKGTDKGLNNDSNNKKKNTKKFMISPVKESANYNISYDVDINLYKKKHLVDNNPFQGDPTGTDQDEHIFNIINKKSSISSKLSYDDDSICNKNENTFSFKNNKYVSPLYTNSENIKKSISSTLSYEPLFNLYDNNENDMYTFRNKTNDKIDKNTCHHFIQSVGQGDPTGTDKVDIIDKIDKNDKNEMNKTNDKNYTTIHKLNFTSLSSEPTLTYIQKDKYKLYNYNIMIDKNSETSLSNNCNIPCYYCRRKFDNYPLGIPIKYYPSLYILNDSSLATSKYSFNYKENTIKLNKNEKERLLHILNNNPNIIFENKYELKDSKKEHKIITKNFFETDGIVCSFNCMVSYIEENSYNPLYQNSYNYIYLMYKHIFGEYPTQTIIRSPSWKLRKEYGGPLDDSDYNKFIQSVSIVESKQIKTINNNIKPEFIFEVLV